MHKSKQFIFILLAFSCFFVAGCGNPNDIKKITPSDKEKQFALHYFESIHNGQIDKALSVMEPKLNNEDSKKFLTKVYNLTKNKPIIYEKLTTWSGKYIGQSLDGATPEEFHYALEYLIKIEQSSYSVVFDLKKMNRSTLIEGFQVARLDK